MWAMFLVSPTYFFRTLCLFKAQYITFVSILSSTFYNLMKTMCRCFFRSPCCSITCLVKKWLSWLTLQAWNQNDPKHPQLFYQTMLDNSFSYLYSMAHQINHLIVITTLHLSYSCRSVPSRPFVKHLIRPKIWLNNLVRHDIVMTPVARATDVGDGSRERDGGAGWIAWRMPHLTDDEGQHVRLVEEGDVGARVCKEGKRRPSVRAWLMRLPVHAATWD